MKKLSFLFLFIFVAFSACQKDNSSPIANEPTNYRVQGITDVFLGDGSTTGISTMATLNYSVDLVGSLQETVALSLSGLPSGVYRDTLGYYFMPTTGIPTFTTRIVLVNAGAAPGTYPVKLNCNGSVTGDKYYTFNVVVVPPPPCNASMIKKYQYCQNYCGSSSYYADTVTGDGVSGTRIYFSNFGNLKVKVYADLNCTTNTLTIPTQIIPGDVISGSGTFSAGYMSIHFVTSTANCNLYVR